MATLGDVLQEIFAPQPGMRAPSYLGGDPDQTRRPSQMQMRGAFPEPVDEKPIETTNPVIARFRELFAAQPPDGMDAKTYGLSPPLAMQPKAPEPFPLQAPPQVMPQPVPKAASGDPWQTDNSGWGADSDAGFAAKRGAIPLADSNDQSTPAQRAGSMTPSVDRGGPMPMSSLPPFRTATEPAPAAAQPNQNSELARAFRAFFTGAAGVNPTSPKFSAFAQGAGGAMKTQYDERQKEELLARQKDKDELDRTLRLTKNDRDEALANNLMQYRNNRTSGVDGKVPYSAIGQQSQVIKGYEDRRSKEIDGLKKSLDYLSMKPEDKKAAIAAINERFDKAIADVRKSFANRTLNPDGVPAQQPTTDGQQKSEQQPSQKPPIKSGDGKSAQSPLAPKSQADIDSAPSGTYFVNPQTGEIFQK